jgi:hypothetical protein
LKELMIKQEQSPLHHLWLLVPWASCIGGKFPRLIKSSSLWKFFSASTPSIFTIFTLCSYFDDLRPYAVVQFVPCIAIPVMAIVIPPMYTHSSYWLWAAGLWELLNVNVVHVPLVVLVFIFGWNKAWYLQSNEFFNRSQAVSSGNYFSFPLDLILISENITCSFFTQILLSGFL